MTREHLLAAVLAERYPAVAQLADEGQAVKARRRHVLERAMAGARPHRRRGPRTRLHRPRLLVGHLERVTPPWESREAWADDIFDWSAA